MPFFIPLQTAYDFRLQLVDNVSSSGVTTSSSSGLSSTGRV